MPTEVIEDHCFAHTEPWKSDFEEAVKVLRRAGKVPKTIGKRVAYLVCNCTKKHTHLDDIYSEIDAKSVQKQLIESLVASVSQTETTNNLMSKCDQTDTEESEKTSVEIENPDDSSSDVTSHEPEVDVSKQNKVSQEQILSDASKNVILKELLNGDHLASVDFSHCQSSRRLFVILALCQRGETQPLEPRALQLEKRKDFRILNRRKYFRKAKKSKYSVVRRLLIRRPTITVSAFVGKQGKNIKTIVRDIDCKLNIGRGSDIDITIHSPTVEDYDVIKRRVDCVIISLERAHHQWLKKQKERAIYWAQTRRYLLEEEKRQPRWEIDEESKASATDEYNKKSSYQKSRIHARDLQKAKVTVLEEGSRCLNCLTPYDKQLQRTDSCRYHPGYVDQTARWTCCGVAFVQTLSHKLAGGAHSVDEQRESHRQDGCSSGYHNWRVQRTKKRQKSTKSPKFH